MDFFPKILHLFLLFTNVGQWTVVLQFLSDEFFSSIYLTVNPLADPDFHQFFDLFEYIIK